jgi:hypothetical protein
MTPELHLVYIHRDDGMCTHCQHVLETVSPAVHPPHMPTTIGAGMFLDTAAPCACSR